jgi:hypothetical protein
MTWLTARAAEVDHELRYEGTPEARVALLKQFGREAIEQAAQVARDQQTFMESRDYNTACVEIADKILRELLGDHDVG